MIRKEIPFIAIAGSGMLLFFLNAITMNSGYGNSAYPTTSALLVLVNNSFGLFLFIIAIFYAGELVWKERSVNIHTVSDALPVSSLIQLLAKFMGLLLVYAFMLAGLIVCCIIIQVSNGYSVFELPVYLGTLYLALFVDLFLYTVAFILIQVLVNNKILGFFLCIAFVIINALLQQLGLKHDLWKYASGTLGSYSMMNAYTDLLIPFIWFKSYWLAFSGLMFITAIVFYVRGSDHSMYSRWKSGRRRITRPLVAFTVSMVVVFLLCGLFIYIATPSDFHESPQQFPLAEGRPNSDECVLAPSITSMQLTLELYPSQRRFDAKGSYVLTNQSVHAIRHIPVHHSSDERLGIVSLQFDRKVKEVSQGGRYSVYELEESLAPGDSVRMDFQLFFQSGRFDNRPLIPGVVHNGSFVDHSYFPAVNYEWKPNRKRKELKDGSCVLARGGHETLFIDAVVGTESGQTIVAPGVLQRQWAERGRSYVHYKTEKVIRSSYFFASARYERLHERWKDIDLDIYYHPAHTYNLQAMIKGMKDGLSYCTENFSRYPFRRLCIVELPFYSASPDSFGELIPFSENKEFIYHRRNSLEVDRAYEETVRQIANQWWQHKVIPANRQKDRLLTEGLSAYTSLMVLKHAYPEDVFNRYVSDQIDRYLRGKKAEKQKEQSLELVADQVHVQQNKAAIAFYALQDYVGEYELNAALRSYEQNWLASKLNRPSSSDLVDELRGMIPDSLQTFYNDLFQSETFFENSTDDVVYRQNRKDEFEVLLSLSCEKIRVDLNGNEEKIPIDDWIDIGIYSKTKSGRDTLIYLQKHRISDKDNLITINIRAKPVRAGIDPNHKLIDRHPQDNVQAASVLMEIPNLEADF